MGLGWSLSIEQVYVIKLNFYLYIIIWLSLFIYMITWDQVMLVQLAAKFFVLVDINYFRITNLFNVLIIILKFSIKIKFKKSSAIIIEMKWEMNSGE